MPTTRRKAHTRKVRGKTVRVRAHRVDHAQTASNLWAATGLPQLFSTAGARASITNAADRARTGRRGAALAWGAAGTVQGIGWATGRTGWALGLGTAALLFAGIGLLANGYRPPKKRKTSAKRARPVHSPAKKPARAAHAAPNRRGTRRTSEDFGPRHDLRAADRPTAPPVPSDRGTFLDEHWEPESPSPFHGTVQEELDRQRQYGPTDRGRRRTDEVI